jgi:hypothetical protein
MSLENRSVNVKPENAKSASDSPLSMRRPKRPGAKMKRKKRLLLLLPLPRSTPPKWASRRRHRDP